MTRILTLSCLLLFLPLLCGQDYGSGSAHVGGTNFAQAAAPAAAGAAHVIHSMTGVELSGANCAEINNFATVSFGDEDCDFSSTGLDMQGSDVIYFDTTPAENTKGLHWQNQHAIPSGTIYVDFFWRMDDYPFSDSANWFFSTAAGGGADGWKIQHNSTNNVRARCDDNTQGSTFNYAVDTTYKVRVVYDISADDMTLYMDTGASWGVTSVSSCNGAGSSNPKGVNTIAFGGRGDYIMYWDDMAICDSDPGTSKCGEQDVLYAFSDYEANSTSNCNEHPKIIQDGTTPDCDFSSAGLDMRGAEVSFLNGSVSADRMIYQNVHPTITSGNLYYDGYWRMGSTASSTGNILYVIDNSQVRDGATLQFQSTDGIRIFCKDSGSLGSTFTVTEDTTYKMRIVYDVSADAADLYMDDVSGDWGGTLRSSCDGTGTPTGINGLRIGSSSRDVYVDDWAVCTSDPGTDKCGGE